jgi:hypothetical protein
MRCDSCGNFTHRLHIVFSRWSRRNERWCDECAVDARDYEREE